MDKIDIEGMLYRSSLHKEGSNDVDWKMREAQVKKACEYSENPELLCEFLREIPVQITRLGIMPRHFGPDDPPRMILEVTVGKDRDAYTFDFGMSTLNTETIENHGKTAAEVKAGKWPTSNVRSARLREIRAGELYDVLVSIGLDYRCPGSFHDFCAEYGYDEDSRKAYATWEKCEEAARRPQKAIPERFIEAMPS